MASDGRTGRKISFTIPCYRSEHTVERVVEGIRQAVSSRPGYDYEIVCVNDCSPDNVISVLRRLAIRDSKVKVIDMARNSGKHAALLASYACVTGEYVVAVDDDGESPIEHLWELIDALDQGADVAIARYTERHVSWLKSLESSVNDYIVRKLLDKPKGVKFSNFVARKKFVCDYLREYPGPYPTLEGETLAVTRNIAMVDMPAGTRISGSSGFTFIRGLKLFFNGCTTYSVVPLRVPYNLSLACLIATFVTLIASIFGHGSLLAALMLFLFTLLFFSVGMLGEYVGRLYMVANHVPQYVIRETINCDEEVS